MVQEKKEEKLGRRGSSNFCRKGSVCRYHKVIESPQTFDRPEPHLDVTTISLNQTSSL